MEKLEEYVQRLEKVVVRFESFQGAPLTAAAGGATAAGAVTGGGGAAAGQDSVSAFKDIIDVQVARVIHIVNTINSEGLILPDEYRNEIVAVTDITRKAFEAELEIVRTMSKCKKPHPEEMQKLVGPLVELLTDSVHRTEGKRTDAFNHQKTVAEFLQALTWIAQGADAGKPALHVDLCWQGAEFYGNKILKEFKTKDPKHVEWVEAIKAVSTALKSYLTKYHMKEPVWNTNGVSVSEMLGTDPPPETPPVETPKKEISAPAPMKSSTYWQPDHKEPAPSGEAYTDKKKVLRKVGQSPSPKAASSPTPEFLTKKLKSVTPVGKQPRMELEMDKKWTVEFYKGNKEVIVDQTSPKHTIYIFQCEDSVIQVKGKVNAITIDSCKKTGIVFEDVVSLVEIINSTRTDTQCTGRVSTITVDKSDECKIYIPEGSKDVGITTAKSSSINITVTKEDPNEDPTEEAIPYQFISTFKNGKLVTEPVEHAGAA